MVTWKRSLTAIAVLAALAFFSPCEGAIETAGELFVDLDARDASAGTASWVNDGTLGDFSKVGNPIKETVAGAEAVTFNKVDPKVDAYQCVGNAPASLNGANPRSIEVWAFNPTTPAIKDEETMVSWAKRGGPEGTNISFGYGKHANWGAVGHWGAPDLEWYVGGGAPQTGQWHHLAYTYDGTMTRVYADGVMTNSELSVLNTHPDTPIVLASQWQGDGVTLDFGPGLVGELSLARVRVHDGALSDAQILNNFNTEIGQFLSAPEFAEKPASGDTAYAGNDAIPYVRRVVVTGIPEPTVEVLQPAGATLEEVDTSVFRFTYVLPDPAPGSFSVSVRATNAAGTTDAAWDVTVVALPAGVATAGEVFVDLDAYDATAGTATWANAGTLGDFVEIGDPVVVDHAGAPGVSFNSGAPLDSYQQSEAAGAPDGLIEDDPTFTVEAWAFNEQIADEETVLAWGKRGGPDGSNMSFNYGANGTYGAIGHWGAPDIGWGTVPGAGQWRHLATTYDGTTTRVYADGVLTNTEVLGAGVLTIWGEEPAAVPPEPNPKITLVAQLEPDAVTLNAGLRGVLSLGRVRIHDGVLPDELILHNYLTERPEFPFSPPSFLNAPAEDSAASVLPYTLSLTASATGTVTVEVVEPVGATLTETGVLTYEFSYALPDPAPESFTVTVRITDDNGTGESTWLVTVVFPELLEGLPVHRYSFTADAVDSIGGADGTVYGNVTFDGVSAVLNNDGSQNSNGVGLFPDPADPGKLPPGAYIDLPNGIISALGNQATFEVWGAWNGPAGSSWQRFFDFGTSNLGENQSSGAANSDYIMLTPRSGLNTLRCGYRVGATADERWVENSGPFPADGSEHHVVVVWDGANTTARLYLDTKLVAEHTATHLDLATMNDVNNWIGRAQFGDPMLAGSLNELRIYNYALNAPEVLGTFVNGPDAVDVKPAGTPVYTGDANCSGAVDIADAICILGYLFGADTDPCKTPCCLASMDTNDSDTVDIADAINTLGFLFAGGSLTAPDTTILSAGQDGCVLYPVEDVVLPCDTPCVVE